MNSIKKFLVSVVIASAILTPVSTMTPATVFAAETNIIANADLNQALSGNPALPNMWQKGVWGTNTAVLTYPVTGTDGTSAARVNVTAYTSGDAKWYFQSVNVTPNTSYHFTGSYTSTVPTGTVAQFTLSNGSLSYVNLGDAPASAGWTTLDKTFITPANAQSVTIFRLVKSVGSLTVDNYFLSPTDSGTTTPALPTVSVTSPANASTVSGTINLAANASVTGGTIAGVRFLVDGTQTGAEDTTSPYTVSYNTTAIANGSHSISAIARDTTGKTATSTVSVTVNNTVTPPPPAGTNVIVNPSLEDANPSNAALPNKWQKGNWGTNTSVFTYPSTGSEGARGAKIAVSSYSNGDAKWFFDDVTVTPSTTYTFSESYKSSVQTTVVARYTSTSNVVSYVLLGTAGAAADWTTKTWSVAIPAGTKSMTVFHLVSSVGTLEIDNYHLSIPGTGGGSDTQAPAVAISSPANNASATGTINALVSASDNVGVSNVKLFIDNTLLGTATSSPYSFAVDTTLYTNGAHTLVATAQDAAGNNATSSVVTINVNNIVADTVPPVTSIVNPNNNSTISGNSVTISVSATDNVGVSAVHIFIDDQNSGIITTAPYSQVIDTTNLTNGVHTITAYAEDAAGNIGNASPVTVTVNNVPVPPPAVNLISNPSLETIDPSDATKPQNWNKGGWGTNDAAFTYPVTGIDGVRAARITISSYNDGDAKWFFADVPVATTTEYVFTNRYKSTVDTTVTARFGYANGTFQYRDIITVPASDTWISATANILTPPDAVSMTVFHLINGIGTLEVDNFSLTGTPPVVETDKFAAGMVSLTFDDGWTSQYDNALPILNAAGLKAGFYIITNEMQTAAQRENRIDNPDLEVAQSGDATRPTRWFKSKTGTNNATFGYPVTGMDSSKGARVTITSYTNGNAKWIFASTTVISGQEYNFSQNYKSTAATAVFAQYTFNDGSTSVVNLANLPASPSWTLYSKRILMPDNLQSLVIYNQLSSTGQLDIDNTYLDRVYIYMTPSNVLEMWNDGHEIGSHTLTHPHLPTLSAAEAQQEIADSRAALLSLGITPVDTFVYPYGEYSPSVIQTLKNAGYGSARSVDRGFNKPNTDKFILQIQQMDNTTTISQVKTWIDTAKHDRTWLILMYHQIENDSTDPLGTTPALLQETVDYLVLQQVPVVTMDEGVAQMLP